MVRRLVRACKTTAVAAMHRSGLLSLVTARRLKTHVSVLTYHRVIDDKRLGQIDSHPGIVVSETTFARHMRLLRRDFNLISLQQFGEHLETGVAFPERSCLVTFDDGWLDNYEIALPILREYNVPATIFLPVDFISSDQMFWQEEVLMRLSWMRDNGQLSGIAGVLEDFGIRLSGAVSDDEDIRGAIDRLKQLGDSEVSKAVERIREVTSDHEARHYNRYLTWEQVQDMRDAGVSFASHSMSHRILTKLPADRCQYELETSRQVLEQKLGRNVDAIAYPNGDCDDRVLEQTRSAGYRMGFTTSQGLFRPGDDPLSIPRQNMHEGNSSNDSLFLARCLNLF